MDIASCCNKESCFLRTTITVHEWRWSMWSVSAQKTETNLRRRISADLLLYTCAVEVIKGNTLTSFFFRFYVNVRKLLSLFLLLFSDNESIICGSRATVTFAEARWSMQTQLGLATFDIYYTYIWEGLNIEDWILGTYEWENLLRVARFASDLLESRTGNVATTVLFYFCRFLLAKVRYFPLHRWIRRNKWFLCIKKKLFLRHAVTLMVDY